MRTTIPKRPAVLAAVVLAVVALAACQPIVVHEDGTVDSKASRAVDPATAYVRGAATSGIVIRMRDCQQVRLEGAGADVDHLDLALRPHAHVTDADGRVLYSTSDLPGAEQVRPAGSYEDPEASDGAHHIVLPVAGARAPLTISTWCDLYTPGSHGLYPRWDFPTCRTSTRRCAPSAPGDGTWQLEG